MSSTYPSQRFSFGNRSRGHKYADSQATLRPTSNKRDTRITFADRERGREHTRQGSDPFDDKWEFSDSDADGDTMRRQDKSKSKSSSTDGASQEDHKSTVGSESEYEAGVGKKVEFKKETGHVHWKGQGDKREQSK